MAQADVIANPSNTVLQGTVIQASLETAITSNLPGQITAIVNHPVYSFDQAQVLIPAGARLIGTYSSDVSFGDRRVLVRWDRVVTPQGQSVQFAAFGGDEQGRSGVTGRVNTRFGLRFGSAALLSVLSAGPSVAASSSSNGAVQQIGEDVAEDLSEAANGVIGELAQLPPIISIEPGAAITVMVDRDLEFFS